MKTASYVIPPSELVEPPPWVTTGGPLVERHSGLSPTEFYEEYVQKNRPVILTDVLSGWPALGKWTLRFFANTYADRTIDFMRGAVKQMKMGEFIEMVEASRPASPPPYWTNNPLMNIFPELMADVCPIPKHLGPNWASRRYLHKPMQNGINRGAAMELYIGGAGGSFPIVHWEGQSTHAFLMQVYGRKQYWAWGPNESRFMYPRTSEGFANLSPLGDVERPDFDRYPLFREAKGSQFHLDPGEVLFLPSRWWHTAKMTEPSITLSINTLDRSNWGGFTEDMLRNSSRPAMLLKKAYLSCAWLANVLSDLTSGPSFF